MRRAIGAAGFEPAAFRPQTECSARLSYAPMQGESSAGPAGPTHYAPPDLERMTARNSAGYEAPVGLAADPVVFSLVDGELSVLLARRLEEPQRGTFALPGGFVGAEESPRETAERKLREKTGVGS